MVGMTVTCALLDALLAPAAIAASAAECGGAPTTHGGQPHPWLVTFDVPALAALRQSLRRTSATATSTSSSSSSLHAVVGRIRASGGHPVMWRLLADEALERLDWPVARRALLALGDYGGLQLLKRLTCTPELAAQPALQAAELHAHFGRFDAAEAAFVGAGRLDLAVELRAQLGHAPRVLELVAPPPPPATASADDAARSTSAGRAPAAPVADPLLRRAHLRAGDYWADRQAWRVAAEHYAAAGATEGLVECLGRCEEFDALAALGAALPAGLPLLPDVASRLAGAGMAPEAAATFERAGLPDCAVAVASRLQWPELADAVLSRRAQAAQRAVIAGARRDSERA